MDAEAPAASAAFGAGIVVGRKVNPLMGELMRSPAEIEADVRRATTWNRPSWPFGTGAKGSGGWRVRDPFDFFEGEEAGGEQHELRLAEARAHRLRPGHRRERLRQRPRAARVAFGSGFNVWT